jgi:hypothetical protein
MNRTKYIIAACALGLFLCATTQAKEKDKHKEIQFTTLPQVVRTTVFHHYNIVSPDKVVRVVEEPDNIYEVTVLTDSGDQIIYVNADGTIVQRPSTVIEGGQGTAVEGEQGTAEVTVTMDEIRSGGERYEFVQDQGPDAIYIDQQTNKRVIVKGGAGQAGHGGVRTKEGSQTNVQSNERTTEKNQTDIRTNEQNRGAARTEERNDQSGNPREKAEQGNADQSQRTMRQDQNSDQSQKNTRQDQGNADQGQKNTRQEDKTQNSGTQNQQRMQQGNAGTPGNGNGQERNGSQRSTNGQQGQGQKQQQETNRTPVQQQQQTHERAQGKGKASPTP